MSEGFSQVRLAQLEERWRREPASRVFLQLAEEYRRGGQVARAAEVLAEGLSRHPDHLAALVALGRCRLELGEAPAAVEAFEKALKKDPTQLVANKLLVQAHLEASDAPKARERLDFYLLFNDRDAEVEALEGRIAGAGRPRPPARRPAPPVAASVPVAPAVPVVAPVPVAPAGLAAAPVGSGRGVDVFELARPAHLPSLEIGPTPAAAPVPAPIAPGWSAPLGRPAGAIFARPLEPFGPIWAGVDARRRRDAALAAEGLFAAAPGGAATAPLETAGGGAAVETAPAERPPWGAAVGSSELELEGREEVVAEPFSPRTIGEEVERETIEEPFDEVLQAASSVRLPPREEPLAPPLALQPELELATDGTLAGFSPEAAVLFEEVEAEALEVEATPPPEPEPEPEAVRSSTTLGELYLAQGYLAEAEAEFRRVIAERGDDEAAVAGLEEVRRRTMAAAAEETASGWAARPAEPAGQGIGLTQRKIATLREYMARLRRSATGDARVS